jgi:hypothetical protein
MHSTGVWRYVGHGIMPWDPAAQWLRYLNPHHQASVTISCFFGVQEGVVGVGDAAPPPSPLPHNHHYYHYHHYCPRVSHHHHHHTTTQMIHDEDVMQEVDGMGWGGWMDGGRPSHHGDG